MTTDTKKLFCLGIACSPRIKGNTSLLLQRALEGAREAGAEAELLFLRPLDFSPCLACNGCFHTGRCVLQDDLQPVYDKILAADRIIMAAPIFSMGLCAQAKMLIDRCQPFWATQNILQRSLFSPSEIRPDRKGFFISTAGSNAKDVFSEAQRVIRYFFRIMESQYLGSYCYPQVDEAGAILSHPEALDQVFMAGRKLVSP